MGQTKKKNKSACQIHFSPKMVSVILGHSYQGDACSGVYFSDKFIFKDIQKECVTSCLKAMTENYQMRHTTQVTGAAYIYFVVGNFITEILRKLL